MVSLKEVVSLATFSVFVTSTFSASLNGTVVTDADVDIDANLGSGSNIPLFFMNDNCRKTIKLYSRNPVRMSPWSTKYPPSDVHCAVLVQSVKFWTYRFVITFKKMELSSANSAGTCKHSRLDLYTANSESSHNRISGTEGICGSKPGFEEYTTKSNVLNLVYTTSGLRLRTYEFFDAVITPYHLGTCKHDEMKCKNGRCIKNDLLCNGYNNCGDNSDEKSCAALLLSVAAIAGIVVGCVVVIGIICSIVICKCCCGACGYDRI